MYAILCHICRPIDPAGTTPMEAYMAYLECLGIGRSFDLIMTNSILQTSATDQCDRFQGLSSIRRTVTGSDHKCAQKHPDERHLMIS